MIGDPDRGWAWTRAFLGLPAKEIHLCGDVTALNVVKKIVQITRDQLTVCHFIFDKYSHDNHSGK